MPYDGSIREELAGYFEAKEPGRCERADVWAMAIGLQKVLLGENNELESRYLLIGIDRPPPTFGGKGGQKRRSEKCGQKTVERVWQLVKKNPHITQAGLVAELNITRSTIQKHLANLKAAGRVRRVGPDKGGHWKVCLSAN